MHVFNGTQWVEAKWGERSLAAESVTALHIKSLEGLNVNDQFIVDSQGNVKFAGNLEGATGVFEGTLKTSENIEVGNLVKVAYTLDGTSGILFTGPEEEVYGKIEYRTGGHMYIVTTELGKVIFDTFGVSIEDLDVTNNLWVHGSIQVTEFDNPLWTGALYPLSTHTIIPSKNITDCMTGWILRWQAFDRNNGTVVNSDFHYVHIPKIHVINNNGAGVRFVLARGGVGTIGKYVYVYHDRIVGYDSNNQDNNHNLVLTGVFEY